jgi:hypothetical protein
LIGSLDFLGDVKPSLNLDDTDDDVKARRKGGAAPSPSPSSSLARGKGACVEDWRRATAFVQLIKCVVEASNMPIQVRQEQVVALLEARLRMKTIVGSRGLTNAGDRHLLAALLLQPQPATVASRASAAMDSEATPIGETSSGTSEHGVGAMEKTFPPMIRFSFDRVNATFEALSIVETPPSEAGGAVAVGSKRLPPRAFKNAEDWENFQRQGNGSQVRERGR